MRGLSQRFMNDLRSGCLSPLAKIAASDNDLDMQIRQNYLNLYYKGNSLLKLSETSSGKYGYEVHDKFQTGATHSPEDWANNTSCPFIEDIPLIKENINRIAISRLEIEYEQLIIRANNYEPRNNSEYFILDRQYASNSERLDLTGFFWSRSKRRKKQTVPLCFMEVKFALNQDIKNVHKQLGSYYLEIEKNLESYAQEMKNVLAQKLELSLFRCTEEQITVLRTLDFSQDIKQCQFILILVDYNPHSSLLNRAALQQLPFSNQIKIFETGFAMWDENLKAP